MKGLLRLLTVGCCVTLGIPAAAASEGPGEGVDEVPVVAQTVVGLPDAPGDDPVTLTVHAVNRIDGGTLAYFSVGVPSDAQLENKYDAQHPGSGTTDIGLITPGTKSLPRSVGIIDAKQLKVYGVLFDEDNDCVCSADRSNFTMGAGSVTVGYAVMAPIPDDMERVDLLLGDRILTDLPVGEGELSPRVPAGGSSDPSGVPLGDGWPTVDYERLWEADPQLSVIDLSVSTTTANVANRSSGDAEVLDLGSDVLFEVDSAELTAEGQTVVDEAGRQMSEADVTGTIRVVGHTDNRGTEEHNQSLSLQRAEAVAASLRSQVGQDVEFEVDGRGEAEPIADNGSEDGRAANRRVTLEVPQ